MARFELLVGSHSQDVKDSEGNTVTETYKIEQGKKRPIIPTDNDLVARFGAGKFRQVPDNAKPSKPLASRAPSEAPVGAKAQPYDSPNGYELEGVVTAPITKGKAPAPEAPPASETDDDSDGSDGDPYDSMTVAQLKEHAKEEEINLNGATTKADIIKALRGDE